MCPNPLSSKAKAVLRGGCEGSHLCSPLEGGEWEGLRLSVSLRVEVTTFSRGRKGILQDFIVLSLGRCAQIKCSWPHRTDASGSLNVSDVAAVALLAHLERSWLYQKVALSGECALSFRNDLGVINFQWHSSPPSFHNAEAFGLVSEGRALLDSSPALENCYCCKREFFPP